MALSNLENRVKQDSAYPRTAEDAIRRDKDIDKVTIKASQIELEGYTTVNGGFKIDETGNMECQNATINGGEVTLYGGESVPKLKIINPYQENTYLEITSGKIVGVVNGITAMYQAVGTNMLIMTSPSTNAHSTYTSYGVICYDTNGNQTITFDGVNGSITCVSLTQTSLAEKKKNFEKLENALDIVKDTDIYKYNLKDEKETDKKHIGFVIGKNFNYREEITSQENDSAELYSMISVLWKAVQEQQAEIEELRKLVNK